MAIDELAGRLSCFNAVNRRYILWIAFSDWPNEVLVLRILTEDSWVHRDISTGNVYYHNGFGLLGDLEYAKQMVIGGGYEILTVSIKYLNGQSQYILTQCSGYPRFHGR